MGVVVTRTRLVLATGWPDASNTGVPAGTSLTSTSGLIDSVSNGEIIDALDVNPGTIRIRHDNVTVKRCRINANATFFGSIAFDGAHTGIVVEDCEIDGNDILASGCGGEGITYRRCNIHNTENGFVTSGNFTARDNYVHDMMPYNPIDDPHIDGISLNEGASTITIEHNNMIMPGQVSAGMTFWDVAGTAHSNITVNNNRLLLDASGAYTVRLPGMNCSANNVTFTSNRLEAGGFGYFTGSLSNITTWSGNVDDSSGTPVT